MIRNKKYLKIIKFIILATIILFALGIIILKYNVEGETNMPFTLSKIAIISSSQGIDQEATNTKWNFSVTQNNDLFLYIDKNNSYQKTEAIKTISIQNIQIQAKKKDNIKIYKPDEQEEKQIFINKEENNVQEIKYQGNLESNLKEQKIANQGGIIAFRCAINDLANYESDEEEINHAELLKKAGVSEEDLNIQLTFTLIIELEGGKLYQSTISLNLPVGNIIEEGTTSTQITEVKDFIFKRIS